MDDINELNSLIDKLSILIAGEGASEVLLMLIKAAIYIIIAIAIFLLFYIGKKFHNKPKPTKNAVVKGRDAYLLCSNISLSIGKYSIQFNGKEIRKREIFDLTNQINQLTKRISACGDFGYGSQGVSDCEKQVYTLLEHLNDQIDEIINLCKADSIENAVSIISNINMSLSQRTEMMKI